MLKNYSRFFVRQHSQSSCGIACLAMIARYYGGSIAQEKLIYTSGTSVSGTTMLGLYHAAHTIGLSAEGFEAEIDDLKRLDFPAILHFVLPEGLEHYVVCFGYQEGSFLIADPAKELMKRTEHEISTLWRSKKLLLVQCSERFQAEDKVSKDKRKWMKELLLPDQSILAVATGLGILVSLVGISLAIFSQKLIDQILPAKDHNKLWMSLVFLAILLLAKNLISYIRTILVARQSRDFANRIVGSFYQKILYLPKPFFDSLKTGEVTARLNDATRIQRTINYAAGTLLVDVLTVVVCAVFLFGYWWMSGVAALCGGLLFALVFIKFSKRIIDGERNVMVSYANAESNFFDTIQGADEIKSFRKEEFFTSYSKRFYAKFQSATFDLALIGNKVGFIVQSISTFAIIAIIAFCSLAVLSEKLSIGALVAVLSLAGSLISASVSLSGAYITFQEAKVAYERLFDFASLEKEIDGINSSQIKEAMNEIDTLDVKDIRFRYPGRPLIINDLGFLAKKGKITVILGDIGSGKSTLLHIMSRFYDPEAGEVYLNGINWKDFYLSDWRKHFGLMPQRIKLFNTSLIENICLTDDSETLERCLLFCRELNFSKFFTDLPQGLFTRVGEDGVNLSGGQRQWVGLCRALFADPKILLLDEPTNNLDINATQCLWELLEREKQNRICILVTHDQRIAIKAETIVRCTFHPAITAVPL